MSSPGWYPDPAGDPDLLRYWDGHGWRNDTRPAPKQEQQGPSAWPVLEQTVPQAWEGPRRRRTSVIVAFSAAAAVVVVGGVVAAVALTGGSDPAPTPTAPSSGSGTTSSASGSPGLLNACPDVAEDKMAPATDDGRQHGGGLSYESQPGFKPVAKDATYEFEFVTDSRIETKRIGRTWSTKYAVGALPDWPGYDTLKNASQSLLTCVEAGEDYPNSYGLDPVFSRKASVDGHEAWTARARIRQSGMEFKGDVVEVVSVDTGTGFSVFYGTSPIGRADQLAVLDHTIATLRVD